MDRNIEVFNWLIPVGRDTTFICGLRSAGEIVSTYQTDSPQVLHCDWTDCPPGVTTVARLPCPT